MKFIFIYLKLVFEFSKNTSFEKDMFNFLFKEIVIGKSINKKLKFIQENSKFYIDIIDLFLKNEFIYINNKIYMIRLKESIMKIH